MCTSPCTGASSPDGFFCGFPRCLQVNVSVLSNHKPWGVVSGEKEKSAIACSFYSVIILLVALNINPSKDVVE